MIQIKIVTITVFDLVREFRDILKWRGSHSEEQLLISDTHIIQNRNMSNVWASDCVFVWSLAQTDCNEAVLSM